jgi:hypothetical protein
MQLSNHQTHNTYGKFIATFTKEDVINVGMSKKKHVNLQHKARGEITSNACKQVVMQKANG